MTKPELTYDQLTENVYLTVTGLIEENSAVPGVNDLFAPGAKCDSLYEQVRAVYDRLCCRLSVGAEDRDLDELLSLTDKICQLVAYEMFRCGTQVSSRGK